MKTSVAMTFPTGVLSEFRRRPNVAPVLTVVNPRCLQW